MMKQKYLNNQKGVATFLALIMIGMLTMLGLAAILTSQDEVAIAGNELQEMRAFYAAEAGLEAAVAILQDYYDSTGAAPAILPSGTSTINHCEMVYNTTLASASAASILKLGTLAGLHADVTSYTVVSTATSGVDAAAVTMAQEFEVALIPIFQFGVFYNNDLEMNPGPTMNLNGRVHTNRDMYLASDNELNMDTYVTAKGNIWAHYKAWAGGGPGDIKIRNDAASLKTMKKGAGWMDADDANWYDSSIVRWDAKVQDGAHGIRPLYVPLNNANDPHKMIERSAGNTDSYQAKAQLTIIDGKVMRFMEDDTWQNVTVAMSAAGAVNYTANKFFDARENENVDLTDLDIGLMYANGYGPRNGVIYFSDKVTGGSYPALRLKNAGTLDAALTIASENPLYTQGDFNTAAKKPAAILADAVTFLSGNWVDSTGALPLANRPAIATTINASIMTGNMETVPGTSYSGGFENLPRLLENWAGRTLNWTGSAVCLWNSAQANSTWVNFYFSAPTRIWQHDADLANPALMPPESPNVRIFQRTGWRQHDIGYAITK